MNPRSIHFRLTFWYTVLIAVTSIGFGSYIYYCVQQTLYQEMQSMLTRRLEHLREDVLPRLSAEPADALAREIQQVYSPEENERFIRISTADGRVLYVSGVPREKSFDPSRLAPPQVVAAEGSAAQEKLLVTGNLFLVSLPGSAGGHEYVLEMGASVLPIAVALRRLTTALFMGLSLVILAAAWGGSLLIRRSLKPVEDMRMTAEQISFGNLRQRLPIVVTGDALEHLSRTLNQMLDRLNVAYEQASRFSADASHELRTPLAVLRSELEAIVQKPMPPERFRERIGSALEEAEYLSNIVDGLFALARLDAGEAKTKNDMFDLSALVKTTLEQMQLVADEKSIAVSVTAAGEIFVRGDAVRIKQVIVNLLDNAIKYTLAGGAVAVFVEHTASDALLTFQDNGIGVSSEALGQVFERFYRADKVRTRSSEGAGLGLSIVRSICQAHGGSVALESEEGRRTTVTVSLPLAGNQPGPVQGTL